MASSPRTPDRPRGASLLEVDSAARARGMSTSPRPNFTLRRDQLRKEEVRVLTLELSNWIASLLQSEDLKEKLFESDAIQSGQLLYDVMTKLGAWPASTKFHAAAKPGSFPARENIQNFVKLALEYGVPKSLTIQPDDILARKNLRDYLLFLMALARAAARKASVPGPGLLRAEAAVESVRATQTFSALPALQPDADTLAAAVSEGLPAAPEGISAEAVSSARARLRASDAGQYYEIQIQQTETWLKGFCSEFKVPAESVPSRLVFSQTDENDIGTIGFNTPALGQLQSALVYSPAVNTSGINVPEAIKVLSEAERAGVSLYVFLGDEGPRNIYYVTVAHGLPMVLNESSNSWEPFAQLIERHITGSATGGSLLSPEPVPRLAARNLDLETEGKKTHSTPTNPVVMAAVGAVAFLATAAHPWVESLL